MAKGGRLCVISFHSLEDRRGETLHTKCVLSEPEQYRGMPSMFRIEHCPTKVEDCRRQSGRRHATHEVLKATGGHA